MGAIYALLAVVIVALVANIAVTIILHRKRGASLTREELRSELMQENELLLRQVEDSVKLQNSALVGGLNAQVDSTRQLQARTEAIANANVEKIDNIGRMLLQNMNDFRAEQVNKLAEVSKELARQLDIMRQANAQNMTDLRAHNERELEKMRQTVDEKLSATLDQRFNQSFKIVNDRLEEINRTFLELQSLQSGVSDLNKIFKNVKTRGTWGEVALGSLLEQILAPEQYDRQVRIRRGSQEAVDFAIRMPGKGDGEVLLPVDSKFPNEDYERLVAASEAGDKDGVDLATKAIADFIKKQAQSIRDKYIAPPKTTDFAIMYLPTEGLYAEVVRNTTLVDELQNKYRVIVCGPTTFAALLNSLQMGFQTLAVEKRSKEIGKLFRAFIGDFEKFEELLQKTHQNINTVGNTLSKAEARTAILRKKLDKVYDLTKDDMDELPAPGGARDELPSTDVDFAAADTTFDFDSEDDDEG